MNKKLITGMLVVTAILSLTACSNAGSKFEGKWECDSVIGKLEISIRNNGGNDYIVDDFPMIGKLSLTYSDGKLIGPNNAVFSIDKKTDKLLGMNVCEMSRAN